MSISKNIARKIVFPAIMKLHLEKLLSAWSEDNKLILVYHGVVANPDHSISVGPIATSQFAQHLGYFKENFDVVSQDAIFKMYRDDYTPKRKTIALTFDDGYENNYTNAFPLLKKYGFPATMFAISNCVLDDEMLTWYDYLDFVKHDLDPKKIVTTKKLNSIAELKDFVKTLNISDRQTLFKEIQKQVNIADYKGKLPREFWKLMNPAQLRELAASGLIEVAAHTNNHPNLAEIKIEDAREEVTRCKQLLEATIDKEVKSIAFPDGSYNDEVKRVCLDAGYKNLLAVDYRCPSDLADKNILPRYCLSSTTTLESNMIQVNRNFKTYGF